MPILPNKQFENIEFHLFGNSLERDKHRHDVVVSTQHSIDIDNEIITAYYDPGNMKLLVEEKPRVKRISGKIYPGFKNNPKKVEMLGCVLECYYMNGLLIDKLVDSIGVGNVLNRDEWTKISDITMDLHKKYVNC